MKKLVQQYTTEYLFNVLKKMYTECVKHSNNCASCIFGSDTAGYCCPFRSILDSIPEEWFAED